MIDQITVALARYQTIIDQPESGELDFDSVDLGATKPTKAAIRVNDVLETITGIFLSMITEELTDQVYNCRSIPPACFFLSETSFSHRYPNRHL